MPATVQPVIVTPTLPLLLAFYKALRFPEVMPFVVEEPRFGAGDARGQPLAVTKRHGLVPAACSTSTGTGIWATSKRHGVICATQSS